MRKITLLILCFACANTFATNYHVRIGGSDLATGLDDAHAWGSLAKVNSFFNSLTGGDSVLLNRGDVFYGSITVGKSGSPTNPIVIAAYGTGAYPVITGFTTINSWTNEGSGVYSKAITADDTTNMVTLDGVQMAVGRFPNTGFMTITGVTTNTKIVDNGIGAVTNWTGAELVIRKNDWTFDRCLITNHTVDTFTYTNLGTTQNATNSFGYFIQNDRRTLDQYGEWFHDYTAGRFYMYFGGVDPTIHTTNVSTISNLVVNTGNFSYVTLTGITFSGCTNDLIHFTYNTKHCCIKNCNLLFAGKYGFQVFDGTAAADSFHHNIVANCNKIGVLSTADSSYICNNEFYNMATIPGQALATLGISAGDGGYNAIFTTGDHAVIKYNTIHNVGWSGVVAKNSGGATLQYNLVDTVCTILKDGGCFYLNAPSSYRRIVDHNICRSAVGNTSGSPFGIDCAGIYLDEGASNVTVTNNTVDSCQYGIKLHKAHNDLVYGNGTYNCGMGLTMEDDGGSNIYADTVKTNILFAKTGSQLTYRAYTDGSNVPTFGTFDSNYYARPIDDNLTFSVRTSTGTVTKNLAGWQAYISQDAHSNKAFKLISTLSDLRLEYNATTLPKVVSLGLQNFVSSNGTVFPGTITLQPFTSAILTFHSVITIPPLPTGDNNLILNKTIFIGGF